jgi:FkbM family methyltransferase
VAAFEPDPVSLPRLRETLAGLPEETRRRIRVVEAATGSEPGAVRFNASGELGSAIGTGDAVVPVVTLDEALSDDVPTYIKMDIESAETATLLGASRVIGRHAPVLAICAYHLQSDVWRLPLLFHSLHPDYRIFVRSHPYRPGGVLSQVENVLCYAIPPDRLARCQE